MVDEREAMRSARFRSDVVFDDSDPILSYFDLYGVRCLTLETFLVRAPVSLLGGFDAVAPAESSKTARCDSQGGGRVCIARIDTGCALDGFSGDGGFGTFLSPH